MIRKPGYNVEYESWFIPLTQGVIALVDADMVPVLAQWNWWALRAPNRWYAARSVRGDDRICRPTYMHRIIMDSPDGMEVDHEKHRPMDLKIIDNRRSNLRVCTTAQNQYNQRPQTGGSSQYKGVHWNKREQKWHSKIKANNKLRHLGYFSNESDAAKAYNAAAEELFGDFGHPNEIKSGTGEG